MGRRGVARWAPLVVVPVLLSGLSGCGGEDEPEPIMPSQSPTASASPSEVAENEPEAWEKRTLDGADALVRAWVEAVNAAGQGDVQPLRALSTAECDTCAGIRRVASETYADGGRIEGGEWRVVDVGASSRRLRDVVPLSVNVDVARQRVFDANGQITSDAPSSSTTLLMLVEWRGDRWAMSEVESVE